MTYGVILFHSNSAAIKTEKLLTSQGYQVTFIPTPRELSSNCGVSLFFAWSQNEAIKSALEKARVEIQGIHQLSG
jgi:hypothetical protein